MTASSCLHPLRKTGNPASEASMLFWSMQALRRESETCGQWVKTSQHKQVLAKRSSAVTYLSNHSVGFALPPST